MIIGLLRAAMVKAGAKDFLIDGFPRALDQAEMFEKMVKAPEMVLAFDCPEVRFATGLGGLILFAAAEVGPHCLDLAKRTAYPCGSRGGLGICFRPSPMCFGV